MISDFSTSCRKSYLSMMRGIDMFGHSLGYLGHEELGND